MCWECETYDHTESHAPFCSGPKYEIYHDMCDEEYIYYRCSGCGSIKSKENKP